MRRRKGLVPLLLSTLLAVAALGVTLAQGRSPQLGLDLQGGASVVLQPEGDPSGDTVDQAIEIIRNRVDALGVAEPEIYRQGDAIIVALPGVRDQQRALEVVGQTAELRFRPVLQVVPGASQAEIDALPEPSTTTVPGDPTATTVPADPSATTVPVEPSDPGDPTATSAPGAPEAEAPPTSDAADTTETSEVGLAGDTIGLGTGTGEVALPAQDTSPPTDPAPGPGSTVTPDASATTVPLDPSATVPVDPTATTPTTAPPAELDPEDPCALAGGVTPSDDDVPEAQIVALGSDVFGLESLTGSPSAPDGRDDCYVLGPVPSGPEGQLLIGSVVSSAEATFNNVWAVSINLRSDGLELFNQVSAECFSELPTCPTTQLGIVLDGRVESAPSINEPSFAGGDLQISGGQQDPFTEGEARDLALVLRFGALPVELVPQTVQEVSASLGRDALDAGILAGIVGVAAVVLYLLAYYRALGLVVVLSLAVWSALNWAIISYLSETSGLALGLAGVTGLVVSVGVTVDSYVVYFERLKDEVREGRSVRASVDKSWKRAWRTILAANVASFIGAATLYLLTVGAVRGFAFFLALATILDVLVVYVFTHPLVKVMSGSRFFLENRFVGISRGLGVRGVATGTATPEPAAASAGRG